MLLLVSGLFSCDAQPEPIRYGVDLCQHCKMTMMDEKFGCELITKKGKIYKYDDVICMVKDIRSGAVAKKDSKEMLVVNFEKKGQLMLVEKASFLLADYIQSPMGSRVAAFSSSKAALQFSAGKSGAIKTWAELEKILP
jgi:copper chaperone NosL